MDVCLISFGKALRKIRKDLNLTQNDVSLLSGINSETIRRIENGKVVPRFETLEFLSAIYKQDLNALFLKHRIKDYSYFHELLNRIEGKFDEDEFYTLNIELEKLNTAFNCANNLFYKNLTKQLILLVQAVISYKGNGDNSGALIKLIDALKITTPSFSLDTYKSFTYSSMEIRILMNIAFVMNRLNNKEEYLEIIEFCVNSVDTDDKIYPKLCHNLAGVYRRNKNFEKALEYSNIGIKSSQENRHLNGLSLLYYGKGIAEYKLNKEEYLESFRTSIYLCKALGQDSLKNTIITNCKEAFNIDL